MAIVTPAAAPVPPGPAGAVATGVDLHRHGGQAHEVTWVTASLLVGGAAVAVGGLAMYLAQGDERAALDARLAQTDGEKVTGISYEGYTAERDRLQDGDRNAALLAGAGVAALGVGTWLWLKGRGGEAAIADATPVAGVHFRRGQMGGTLAWRF